MNREEKLRELARLEAQVRGLKEELASEAPVASWPPVGYYSTYHVLGGMILGFFGAASSLLFNVVGSALTGRHPLELIRVYLTFPLGEKALGMESGLALALGCGLYLGTGMFYGVFFHIVLTRYLAGDPLRRQFLIASLLALGLWLLNFYGVLSWLQPMLFGGAWIVRLIPWWVAALTHLVFAWTMLFIKDWGEFDASHYASTHSAPPGAA